MSILPHRPRMQQRGFSLLEMSIVLTLIALLVGGVMVGRHLIQSSRMQATVSRVEEFNGAIGKFRDRFIELPGDFSTATANWTGVANGNGDGRIGGKTAFAINTDCAADDWAEQWNVWTHLSKAGLIAGQFTNSGNVDTVSLGVNTPEGAMNRSGYTVRFCGEIKTSTEFFASQYAHVIQLGSVPITPMSGGSAGGLFTTKEAGAIDTKLDDSFPHTGKVMGPKKNNATTPYCTNSTSNAPVTADYDFNYSSAVCPLFFKLGF